LSLIIIFPKNKQGDKFVLELNWGATRYVCILIMNMDAKKKES